LFRQKRGDTRVDSVEAQYNINLNARGDALLGNLLDDRGFGSLSQLLTAYRGNATSLARRRRLFLSFHAEDRQQVQGFRLMAHNPALNFDFLDASIRAPVDSDDAAYVRQVIRGKIERASIVLCLIGDGTAWRDWVDWELATGRELGKGLCGVRLKGSRGQTPGLLASLGSPVARWDLDEIVAVIECAAARRS
jgi:hypothetical protein